MAQHIARSPPLVSLSYLALLAFTVCRSEAFASSHSRFATGRRLYNIRGGSEATSQSMSPLTCLMQTPPTRFKGGGNATSYREDASSSSSNILIQKTINGNSTNGSSGTNGSSKSSGLPRRMLSMNNGNGNSNYGLGMAADPVVPAEYVAESKLPTDIGQFQLRAYRVAGLPVGTEPCVIYARDKPPFGVGTDASGKDNLNQHVSVRIHDQCLTSEVFRSQRCDCKEQLHMALAYIQEHGGCIIYLQQEGRGIGLANKIAAYALQDDGLDTVDANLHLGFPEDSREYGVVPSILLDMKIGSIQLMTNNPRKVERLRSLGVNVERTLPMVVPKTNPFNRKYMETKQERMNHANLSALFTPTPSTTPTAAADGEPPVASVGGEEMLRGRSDGQMAPSRKSIASQYINNGTEFGANAVQVSLMVCEDEDSTEEEEAAGVTAADDGYCFGKESVVKAIEAVGRGEMVVVVDDMDRENEGDFIMAADQCTALDMARIVRYSSGVVCVAMEDDHMEALNLPPMLTKNEDPKGTAFSVTVDATKEHGITTGISALDRATTIRMLADPTSTAVDFNRPGHLFPLRARAGGVLERDGHTEASVDLARLAGRSPVGVLCEIVSEENPIEMMRLPEIKRFCKQHGYVLTSIVDIAQFRRETGQ